LVMNPPRRPTRRNPQEKRGTNLKRYASLGVSLLAVLVVLGLMASPADARRHRHHRHHHRGSGPAGPVCGPGTVNIGGVCTAVPPAGPLGNANINISPSNVTM